MCEEAEISSTGAERMQRVAGGASREAAEKSLRFSLTSGIGRRKTASMSLSYEKPNREKRGAEAPPVGVSCEYCRRGVRCPEHDRDLTPTEIRHAIDGTPGAEFPGLRAGNLRAFERALDRRFYLTLAVASVIFSAGCWLIFLAARQ